MTTRPICSHCGSALPFQAALCPFCATVPPAVVASHPSLAPTEVGSAGDAATTDATPLFEGVTFGPYRIGRLLGRGGMGEVHEAEHVVDGRTVALKLLHHRLASPADRARFLREGQLAAAISHPNSVYVFGSDEINGVPVISMELLPGGTLKDRVEDLGPMGARDAVDAMLHVIGGLEAAQALGILHRDVKPSNCFVDLDGTVKIGDFGLSISTAHRLDDTLTRAGVIQGTPQYAAPEQLRGDPLDVRADIYAIGATLYYLLTARPPFEAPSLPALIARVMSDPAPSVREAAPDVPAPLDRIIGACLAKAPAGRPGSYARLRDALRPFSAEVLPSASLPLRTAAGVLDQIALLPVTGPIALGVHQGSMPVQAGVFAAQILYFALLEGIWGMSAGKRIVGLRVVRSSGALRVGLARAAGRATLYTAAWHAWPITILLFEQTSGGRHSSGAAGPGVLLTGGLLAALFYPARARNDSAAAHDVLTGTRVIERWHAARDEPDIPLLHHAPVPTPRSFGPYEAIGTLGIAGGAHLLVGHDAALRRHVWIHEVPSNTPAVAPARRRLARPARLRWLSGRRGSDMGWDAYEAREGAPLHEAARTPQPWSAVRRWLLTLVVELQQGVADATLPPLSTDHVWLAARGDAVLLDFEAWPPPVSSAVGPVTAQRFLFETAALALTGAPASSTSRVNRPLPLTARDVLARLAVDGFDTIDAAHAAIRDLAQRPHRVSRRRRAASCLVSTGLLFFLASSVTVVMALFRQIAGPVRSSADVGQRTPLSVWPPDPVGLVPPFMTALAVICVLAAAGAFATRGGVSLRYWGLAVTDRTGRNISPPHALWRAFVAVSPILVAAGVIHGTSLSAAQDAVVAAVALGLWIAGLIYALAVPERGIQDYVAGTWLVPR
jgi:eukaryotic-like serine/threonine-protein kinase